MSARFYVCQNCGRLLVSASDGGKVEHECEDKGSEKNA